MTASRRQPKFRGRNGLTLIELIIVILIVIVLAALFLPATRSAGRSARKVQCLSNMRNVGLAVQNFASANEGVLPPLTSKQAVSGNNGDGTMDVGWPIVLLPALDNTALLRAIRSKSLITNGTATIAESENVRLEVFTCPDNPNPLQRPGGLSYVANAGFISSEVWGIAETTTLLHQPYLINWKGSTTPPFRSADGTSGLDETSAIDRNVALATGVFWRPVGDEKMTAYSPTLGDVSMGDGMSNTLMLTENLNAGLWHNTDVNLIGFGIRIPVSSRNFAPSVGAISPYGEFDTVSSLKTDFPGSTFVKASSGSWINQAAKGVLAPRPSSKHRGGVNVIMADGSGRFCNENMDPIVYGMLVTSDGKSFCEPELNQPTY